jgi:hypothetical protein
VINSVTTLYVCSDCRNCRVVVFVMYCRGVGLWGVWETSSGTGTHFELQKGGVFRAAPLLYC